MTAAAVTPERSEVCAETCGHGGCDAVRQLAGTLCALCGEPIGYSTTFLRQAGWRLLGHRACALADLHGWERIGGEASSR
ncbi:MAG: hypothetical protein ACRDYX_21880 [Egibacteraceae bacterium]